MSTYRQVVYMILDEVKMRTDDTLLETSQIVFLLNKTRASYIKQKYGGQVKKIIPLPYYQQLSILLAFTANKSLKALPDLIDLNGIELTTDISANTVGAYKISIVTPQRFEYVGINKWLTNMIYCTIWYDKYLHFKCAIDRPNIIFINGILEQPQEIINFNNVSTGIQNPLDLEFPVEEAALSEITAIVLRELADIKVLPYMDKNNATEDNLLLRKEG